MATQQTTGRAIVDHLRERCVKYVPMGAADSSLAVHRANDEGTAAACGAYPYSPTRGPDYWHDRAGVAHRMIAVPVVGPATCARCARLTRDRSESASAG
jgi:hypothetical protein